MDIIHKNNNCLYRNHVYTVYMYMQQKHFPDYIPGYRIMANCRWNSVTLYKITVMLK